MNLETDYLVIGSGAAGLSFALKAAEHSHVIVVTKGEMNECNTNYAQGGICCVTYEPDTFQKHIDDTMVCGGGICDMQAVELVVMRAPQLMKDLVQWGTRFDKTREGRYELAREGGIRSTVFCITRMRRGPKSNGRSSRRSRATATSKCSNIISP